MSSNQTGNIFIIGANGYYGNSVTKVLIKMLEKDMVTAGPEPYLKNPTNDSHCWWKKYYNKGKKHPRLNK